MTDRQQLRQQLKDRRSQLSIEERWQKANLATLALTRHRIFKQSEKIALYVSIGAECPTLPLSLQAQAMGKALYFPRTDKRRHGQMDFVHSHATTRWQRNRFGIPEPLPYHRDDVIKPRSLNLIILPLAGFDNHGNRIGMGAGYYDRCLAFRRHRKHWRRPLLIGLAYDCQQTDRIPAQPWDVALDGVATENGLKFFNNNTDN